MMWRRWVETLRKRLIGSTRAQPRACAKKHPEYRIVFGWSRLGLEHLESRIAPSANPVASYATNPLSFAVNQGQTASQVRYLSEGSDYALFLTPTQAFLSLDQPAPPASAGSSAAASTPTVISMQLLGANPAPQMTGLDQLPGTANYITGNNPSDWITGVNTYGQVQYQDVYPGIDLLFHGNQQQLEYDFTVKAGANPGAIKLNFQGVTGMTLDAQGNLVLQAGGGDVVEHAPVLYQAINGTQKSVSGSYMLLGNGQVGFQVGAYDTSKPLIIDPVLGYASYFGGSLNDSISAIATDSSGNTYITGSTESTDLPVTAGVLQPAFGGLYTAAFVAKLSPSGTVVWSTYLGGNSKDVQQFTETNPFFGGPYTVTFSDTVTNSGTGIAVDANGNVYITGSTVYLPEAPNIAASAFIGFVPTVNAFDPQPSSAGDYGFVAALAPDGSHLLYASYLEDQGLAGLSSSPPAVFPSGIASGIAVDSLGNAYVTGNVSVGNNNSQGFAAKVSYSGQSAQLAYFVPLGSPSLDGSSTIANSIAVDASGNVYVGGDTNASNFATNLPVDATGAPVGFPGGYDGYVVKLDSSGNTVFATRIMGNADDLVNAVAVDAKGDVYLGGTTLSTQFPLVNALQSQNPERQSYSTGFVAELSPSGNQLVYSTYLGGNGANLPLRENPDELYADFFVGDSVFGIAVDAAGNAYATGETASTNFPSVNPVQATPGGGYDAFVTKISPGGTAFAYSTYLGGTGNDQATGIALDQYGEAYIAGITAVGEDENHIEQGTSPNFPATDGTTFAGGSSSLFRAYPFAYKDGFIAKIANSFTVTALPVKAFMGQLFTGPVATFTVPDPTSTYTATINWGDGTPLDPTGVVQKTSDPAAPFRVIGTHTYSRSGDFPVVVTVTDQNTVVVVNGVTSATSATTAYDVSQLPGDQSEPTIAINPKDSSELFEASNNPVFGSVGLFAAYSKDGGVTWTPSNSSTRLIATGATGDLPSGTGGDSDPKAVFDQYGNLFLTYLTLDADGVARTLILGVSKDGGQTFTLVKSVYDATGVDQPSVATGPGVGGTASTVWLTYLTGVTATNNIVATGANVTGLGASNIGPFSALQVGPGPNGADTRNFGDVAVGPEGQVVIDYQAPSNNSGPSSIYVNIDADGLGSGGFGPAILVTKTQVGGFYPIPPQDTRTIAAEANLAFDMSNGPHRGRLYLAYTDAPPPNISGQVSPDTNIFVVYSDNDGVTWGPTDSQGNLKPTQVNDDQTGSSQFLPSIAVDPITGDLAIAWYDARNDPNDIQTQFFAAVSSDGGLTFSQNVPVSAGYSQVTKAALDLNVYYPADLTVGNIQFGDYTGVAFLNGILYPAWTDNSEQFSNNPDKLVTVSNPVIPVTRLP